MHVSVLEEGRDKIITGSASVYIGGKPAARLGDLCAHGGKVTIGSGTVFIGGDSIRECFPKHSDGLNYEGIN